MWAKATMATLGVEELDVLADRGYFSSEEILACDHAGITVTLPKPMTSGSRANGRFVKADFVVSRMKMSPSALPEGGWSTTSRTRRTG